MLQSQPKEVYKQMWAQLEKKRLSVVRNKKTIDLTCYVTNELKDKENLWNKITHMLACYAEYSNVGGNRTAAYGQTKLQVG